MTTDWDRRLNPFRYDANGNLTEAAKQQDEALHLDSYDGSGPSGPKLHVTAGVLNDRADKTDKVASDFHSACESPMKSTGDVAKGLKGFRSASAFATFEERWRSEAHYVENQLLAKFAQDLRDAATAFTTHDTATADQFSNQH